MNPQAEKPPFFIVGCTRSGTTLLQVLIDAHSKISIPPESHIFIRFSESFEKYGKLTQQKNLKRLVKDLLNDFRIKQWRVPVTAHEFCNGITEFTTKGVVSRLFELYAKKEGKQRWGDKTPQHILYLKEIKKMFPNAKLIHLIRDGRDVAESLRRVFIGPKSIYRISKRWCQAVSFFYEFKKTINPADYLEVRYEDVVADPRKQLERIFQFLGEEVEGSCLAVQDTDRRHHYIKSAAWHSSLKDNVTDKKIGIFKKTFNKHEIEIFESIAGNMLETYGYSLETSGDTKIKPYEHLLFFFQDYIYRYLRKINHLKVVRQDFGSALQLKWRKIKNCYFYKIFL